MEVLRNLFGNLTSGIIRLGVTVGILAAVYFFLLRPVLDTTNHAIDESSKVTHELQHSFGPQNTAELNKILQSVGKQVQVQVHHSFHISKVNGTGSPKKLLRCVKRSAGDVHRIERCAKRY